MTQTASASRRARIFLTTVIAGIALATDLLSKAWAWNELRGQPRVEVVANWLYFDFEFNPGAAFSFLHDVSFARVVFIAISVVASGYMVYLARTLPTARALPFVGVGLVAGGILGNFHDRLFRALDIEGQLRYGVVDFIRVYYWPGKPWPVFNVADAVLLVGIVLLMIGAGRERDGAA